MKEYQSDLLIIGCGIVGLTTATLAAIRNPSLSMTLVDKNLIGFGASGYSAGFSTPLAKTDTENGKKLIIEGSSVMQELQDHIDLKLKKKQAYYIVGATSINNFQKYYIASDLEDSNDCALKTKCSIGNYLNIPTDKKIYFSRQSAHCADLPMLMNQMSLFLRRKAHMIFECSPIHHMDKEHITLESGVSLKSKKNLFTTGPWQYGEALQKTNQVKIKKVAALHLASIPAEDDPAIIFFDEKAFLLPLPEKGYWLMSFTSEDWDVAPKQQLTFSEKDLEIALGILRKYSNKLGDLFSGGRVFCDHYSPSGEISISTLSKANLLVEGASGSGYRFSYAIASQICREFLT